ncbi:glycosyltransferase family 2 protein [Methyloversatilis sp. MC4-4]|uniref:glycosyltransferase family 2 protein n=1 Tax=Methyloversatilis sp. MC4-4 TaxID=3132824 RepID=UPI003CE6AC5D
MTFPLISICVPAYNGGAHLERLLDALLALGRSDFEIVVTDDCSLDGSWEALTRRASLDARLCCERNAVNLGMDRNFAHVASLARGQYLWFSGQDDLIQADGLARVLDFLAERPDIDFVLMNHAKRVAGRFGEHVVEAARLDQHVFGVGLQSYVTHTRHHLPTFLPTFLIRTQLWRSVDVSRYFGTCYCQVGVFLEAARDIRWCHFAGNHVIGLLPQDGWQANPSAYAKIAFGHFAMLVRAATRAPWVTQDMLRAFFRLQKRRLVYSFMLLRHHRLQIDPALVDEVTEAVRPFAEIARPASMVRLAPRMSSSLMLGLIESRRALRALLKARHRS